MEDNSKTTNAEEVGRRVMTVQEFMRLRGGAGASKRDLMRKHFIMATTPPPQRQYDQELPKRKKRKPAATTDEEGGEEVVEEGLGEDEFDDYESSEEEEQDFYQVKQKELDDFYKKLVYDLPDPPKTTKRNVELAATKKRNLVDLIGEHKRVLVPERRRRIKGIVKGFQPLTAEDLEKQLRDREAKMKDKQEIRRKRGQAYREMLARLERQCKEKLLHDLFDEFSCYLANYAVAMEKKPEVCPANVKRLIDVIQYNIYQTCKITPQDQYVNGPLYRAISTCLASLVVDVMYAAQCMMENEPFSEEKDDASKPKTEFSTEVHDILKKRARIAARRKFPLRRKDLSVYSGPPPKMDEIVKLCRLIGGS